MGKGQHRKPNVLTAMVRKVNAKRRAKRIKVNREVAEARLRRVARHAR
jgi:hypothetical protein